MTVTSPVRDPIPGGSRDLLALRPRNADAGVGCRMASAARAAARAGVQVGGLPCVNLDVSQILDSHQRMQRQESRI